MPTGIWETSSGDLNSPEGNDGHYYRVFCKANSFQQAYRIASSAESSLAYFRYCNNGIWRNWYKPYISNADLFRVHLSAEITNGFIQYYNSEIKETTVCVASIRYTNPGFNYNLAVQPKNGYAYIYFRNPDGTVPPDGTIIDLYVIFY